MEYKFSEIEKKWQDIWEKEEAFKAKNDFSKPKFYGLIEFPYPSGNGLHVGHPKSNTAIDIICRKRRMEGYNVLYPIGWDAFGLPTENYAIKNKIHPAIVTRLAFLLTGTEKLTLRIQAIISGRNGFSYNFISTDLLIKLKYQ